jgi:alkanesulfonate monooxygenase SsuD/methylene tetrahydromethanopterin reductase-like flavin-dependent oxidoreductase (luciferase family)
MMLICLHFPVRQSDHDATEAMQPTQRSQTMTRLNPQTTPRHQLRAEKARRNKGETGSATGSRNRSNALNAFIGKKAEIDERLARLQALSDDHFNCHPDEVGWAMVGTLDHYNGLLKRITDSAFGEGEYEK